MWRRQRLVAGLRAGWNDASGTRRAIYAGAGVGIICALVALVVTQAI